MCYWVREPDRRRSAVVDETPAKPDFVRPRLVGAVAAALIALIATAALLVPSSTVSSEKSAAVAAAAVAAPREAETSGPVIEQTATLVDDGVPSSSEVAHSSVRAGGHCDHGL